MSTSVVGIPSGGAKMAACLYIRAYCVRPQRNTRTFVPSITEKYAVIRVEWRL